jgi:hypothetical protein
MERLEPIQICPMFDTEFRMVADSDSLSLPPLPVRAKEGIRYFSHF